MFLVPPALSQYRCTLPAVSSFGEDRNIYSEDEMALSRLAQQFADEIRQHDWSDAPYRADRAGHDRSTDTNLPTMQPPLTDEQTLSLLLNVVWVTGQVLAYNDPNFSIWEFALACGVPKTSVFRRSDGKPNQGLLYGLRWREPGQFAIPGTWDYEGDPKKASA